MLYAYAVYIKPSSWCHVCLETSFNIPYGLLVCLLTFVLLLFSVGEGIWVLLV